MTPVRSINTMLAGEHAAVYIYAVLAAQTSNSTQPALSALLLRTYSAHRAARDRLTATVVSLGGSPVASEATYALPNPAATPQEVREAALEVERRLTAIYCRGVAETVGGHREAAMSSLRLSAGRQLSFRGTPETFPGIDWQGSSQ